MHSPASEKPILCPSAEPDMADATVFGVQTGNLEDGLRVGYLTEAQPVTPDILAATGEALPTQVLRVAAPCMGNGCKHFDGAGCQLAFSFCVEKPLTPACASMVGSEAGNPKQSGSIYSALALPNSCRK